MKTLTIILAIIFLTSSNVFSQSPQTFPEFYKFIRKNYRVGTQQKAACKIYNASIVLSIDKSNRITDFEVKTEFREEVKSNLGFIKGYQFPVKNLINQRAILFFMTFDLDEICPNIPTTSQNVIAMFEACLTTIRDQLKTNPETIVLYEVVPIKIFKPIIN